MYSWSRKVTIGLGLYVAVGGITLAVLATAYDLWRANIRVPVDYRLGCDTYLSMVLVKSVADTGWYLNNPRLGTPGAMQLYDFPLLNTGLFLFIKFLSYFINHYAVLFNVTYFSTYIFAAWSALFSARRLGVSIPIAMAVAILFAFAPYHYWRGAEHLLLSDYASIPLVVLVSLWICGEGESLFFRRDSSGRIRLGWQGDKSWTALFAAAAISLGFSYYVFFGSFFMVISGLIARARGRIAGLLDAVVIVLLIIGSFGAQLIPVIAFHHRNGPNLLVAGRSRLETSVYSLHLTDMLEPIIGHRLEGSFQPVVLDNPDSRPQTPRMIAHRMNEARLCSPLGFLGASGLLYLLAWLAGLMNIADRKTASILQCLAQLTLATLLLAVSGGICEVIAAHFFSIIRCYNRMSIYIEFMSLLSLAVLADSGRRRFGWTGPKFLSAIAAVVLFGLLDQTPVPITPDHQAEADAFEADRRFVQRIESNLASGSRIFQLPHAQFPEGGRIFKMADHDHFRAYLHSKKLRWSYGAVKGRKTDAVLRKIAALDVEMMIPSLLRVGFAGIYINRVGFPDAKAANTLVDRFALSLGRKPIVSENGQLVFFKLPTIGGEGPAVGDGTSVRPEGSLERGSTVIREHIVKARQGLPCALEHTPVAPADVAFLEDVGL